MTPTTTPTQLERQIERARELLTSSQKLVDDYRLDAATAGRTPAAAVLEPLIQQVDLDRDTLNRLSASLEDQRIAASENAHRAKRGAPLLKAAQFHDAKVTAAVDALIVALDEAAPTVSEITTHFVGPWGVLRLPFTGNVLARLMFFRTNLAARQTLQRFAFLRDQ